jgi:hypothetical protein
VAGVTVTVIAGAACSVIVAVPLIDGLAVLVAVTVIF